MITVHLPASLASEAGADTLTFTDSVPTVLTSARAKAGSSIAAVPTKLCEEVYLIGPMGKIKDDLEAWKRTCVTTLLVGGPPQLLETMAKAVL